MLPLLLSIPGKLNQLLARLTPGRAASIDYLDVPVSSRAPASTALSTAVWTQGHADAVIAGGGLNRSQEFTAVGAFTFYVPAGVSVVYVTLQAPGGGGQSSNQGGGGGGSGELLRRVPYPVAPGGTVNGSIGNGGGDLVTSTFGALVAHGGRGNGPQIFGGQGGGPLGGLGGDANVPRAPAVGSVQLEVIGGSGGGAGGGNGSQDGAPCGRFKGGQSNQWCGGGAASYFADGASANQQATPTQPGIGAGGGGTLNTIPAGRGGVGYAMIEWVGG